MRTLFEFSLQRNRGGLFLKGIFRDRFLKGTSSRGLPGEAVEHRNSDFHAALSVSVPCWEVGLSSVRRATVQALPAFRRAEPAFSSRVQRNVVRSQGHSDAVPYLVLNFQGSWVRGCP